MKDPEILARVEFYSQDIRILNDLGFEVTVATKVRDLRPADMYFVWWWTWAYFPVAFAQILQRPVIITGTMNWHQHYDRNALHRRMIEFALRKSQANIFVSELELKVVTQNIYVANPIYSPHTFEAKDYYPTAIGREEFCLSVAWTGSKNGTRKCVPEIIDAAVLLHNNHPNLKFLIAGARGDGYPKLQHRIDIAKANSYIRFLGIVTKDEKIDLMRRCKIYLSPSRFEGFGLAILEAMACGAAVISSPVGAVPEVVGKAGVLVDGTNPAAIAEAVEALITDDNKRLAMGRAAADRAYELFQYDRRKTDIQRSITVVLATQNAAFADF